jgi:DNA polymerase (family X)
MSGRDHKHSHRRRVKSVPAKRHVKTQDHKPPAHPRELSREDLQLARSLEEIGADYLAVGEKFKARPFLLAAGIIREGRREELQTRKIPGIGPGTLDTISDLERGASKRLEDLRARVRYRSQLLKIPGIAVKRLEELSEMGIHSPDDLRRAIDPKSPGYNLVAAGWITPMQELGLRYLDDLNTPIPRDVVRRTARAIFGRAVTSDSGQPARDSRTMVIAGSYRREKPFSGDIDILCVGYSPEDIEQILRNSGWLVGVFSRGPAKITVLVKEKDPTRGEHKAYPRAMQMDVRMIFRREWGTALLYFTGSKDFNRDMRQYAKTQGYSLSEYGLKSLRASKTLRRFGREENVFRFLGLRYVEPRDRERFRADTRPPAKLRTAAKT